MHHSFYSPSMLQECKHRQAVGFNENVNTIGECLRIAGVFFDFGEFRLSRGVGLADCLIGFKVLACFQSVFIADQGMY